LLSSIIRIPNRSVLKPQYVKTERRLWTNRFHKQLFLVGAIGWMGSLQKFQLSITLIGIFFLGCFFGFLTSLAVDFSSNVNLKLKIISALICASLAGALVFFVPGLAVQKWMYPIGLVIGFLPARIVRARNSESSYWMKHARVDTILILIFTSVVIFCATLATTNLWYSFTIRK
jgi:hypothetical protein